MNEITHLPTGKLAEATIKGFDFDGKSTQAQFSLIMMPTVSAAF